MEIILLLRREKTARNFLCMHTHLLMCPFMHRTGQSSPRIYVRRLVVPSLKTGLIFPWELGGDGTIPPPLEGLWGLPHCYPAFPWDVSVHGITMKGKDSLLAFLNTNNDFRGRKRTIRYCYIVPYLSLTLKYLRSPMNNAASAPSLFCTSH